MAPDQETINVQLDLLAAHRRTLALNLERAAGQGAVAAIEEEEGGGEEQQHNG